MKKLFMIAVLLFSSVTVGHAQGQACMSIPRDALVESLKSKHKEQAVGIGIGNQGQHIVELFASKRGSFTLIIGFPDGRACMIASGAQWHAIKPDLALFDLPS